jgi:hypothetical protein
MTPSEFQASLERAQPPRGLTPALRALWWLRRGDWDKAHRIVMDEADRDSAWVHAHLHRAEGDAGNAGYWYRQARRQAGGGSLEQEWNGMVQVLLGTG